MVCVYLVHFRSNATVKLNVMESLVMLFFILFQKYNMYHTLSLTLPKKLNIGFLCVTFNVQRSMIIYY